MSTTDVTMTILEGNLGEVTTEEANSYADAVEAALVEAFPDATITVNLVLGTEGVAPATVAYCGDEPDEDAAQSADAISERIFERGAWL